MSRGYRTISVTVEDLIPEWGEALEAAVADSLEEYIPKLVESARVARTEYHIVGVLADVDALPIVHGFSQFQSGIGDSNWKAVWFEKGTKAHSNEPKAKKIYSLTAKGNKRRKAPRGSDVISGVRGVHYLRDSLYKTFPGFIEMLGRHLGDARV